MLTPIFSITQNESFLIIEIKASHARIDETEIEFDGYEFRFYSKPYFLRLNLPGKVIQNGSETVKYDCETGTFTLHVPKETNEHFEGLDMITKLLEPISKKKVGPPLIEVINSSENPNDSENEDEYSWDLLQEMPSEDREQELVGEKYGFANSYTGILAKFADELAYIIDLNDPEHKTLSQRRQEREADEKFKFSDEHYLSDMFDQKEIVENLIRNQMIWDQIETSQDVEDFSLDEKYKLKNLPNKEYICDKKTTRTLLLGMVDILYAYAYEVRTTEAEMSVESGWTIAKLSATLSWLDSFDSLHQVVNSCVRRSLCYPLYRNWRLALKVLEDTKKIIKLGRRFIVKCLIDVHKIMNQSGDCRYILNEICITDYCIWAQQVKPSAFESLAKALDQTKVSKCDIDLDLEVLEQAARLALEEHQS